MITQVHDESPDDTYPGYQEFNVSQPPISLNVRVTSELRELDYWLMCMEDDRLAGTYAFQDDAAPNPEEPDYSVQELVRYAVGLAQREGVVHVFEDDVNGDQLRVFKIHRRGPPHRQGPVIVTRSPSSVYIDPDNEFVMRWRKHHGRYVMGMFALGPRSHPCQFLTFCFGNKCLILVQPAAGESKWHDLGNDLQQWTVGLPCVPDPGLTQLQYCHNISFRRVVADVSDGISRIMNDASCAYFYLRAPDHVKALVPSAPDLDEEHFALPVPLQVYEHCAVSAFIAFQMALAML